MGVSQRSEHALKIENKFTMNLQLEIEGVVVTVQKHARKFADVETFESNENIWFEINNKIPDPKCEQKCKSKARIGEENNRKKFSSAHET